MEQVIINLVAGALGGNAVGKASPTFDLGTLGNTIAGLVGGGVLGQIVVLLIPAVTAAAQSGNLSIGGIITQIVSGGAVARPAAQEEGQALAKAADQLLLGPGIAAADPPHQIRGGALRGCPAHLHRASSRR